MGTEYNALCINGYLNPLYAINSEVMAGKVDHYDCPGLGTQDIKVSDNLDSVSFKPKILMDSESTCSIEFMEKMLLKRLLTKKELENKSMHQRLEEQELLIQDLKDKVSNAEVNQNDTFGLKTVRSAAQFLTTGSGLIWRFLCGLAFYSYQVFKMPFYPSILMIEPGQASGSGWACGCRDG
eukprot:TRINITY_DN36337_c0_g1_i1.p1 TRINITY_DN36337_c0_g1~~TRINITY_DN36337_c0_g1_i1.p1  ORF type:complete len:189 (-),score=34.23 TRINITY_DN36337_c0_g1_i1:36-578(-)